MVQGLGANEVAGNEGKFGAGGVAKHGQSFKAGKKNPCCFGRHGWRGKICL